MNRFIRLIILIFLISCTQGNDEEQLITEFYSDKEITELDKLSNFVFKEISKNCSGEIEDCFKKYFKQFQAFGANENVALKISQDLEKKLLANFNDSLFHDIWTFCEVNRSNEKGDLINIRQLCLKPDERFSAFLIKLTENHGRLNIYRESYKSARDYTPAMNGLLLKQPERFDFESKDEFLVVAIHLLTLNYPEEKL